MKKINLVFDLDGVLYPLFKIPNFKERINARDATVYTEGSPMISVKAFNQKINELKNHNDVDVTVSIVSYTGSATEGTTFDKEWHKKAAKAKKEWVKKSGLAIDHIRITPHTVKKATTARKIGKFDEQILFDDSRANVTEWNNGRAYQVPWKAKILDVLSAL